MLVYHTLCHGRPSDYTDQKIPQNLIERVERCTIDKAKPHKYRVRTFTSTQDFQWGFTTNGKSLRCKLSDNQVAFEWSSGSVEVLVFDNLSESADFFKQHTNGTVHRLKNPEDFTYIDYGNPFSRDVLIKLVSDMYQKLSEDDFLTFLQNHPYLYVT